MSSPLTKAGLAERMRRMTIAAMTWLGLTIAAGSPVHAQQQVDLELVLAVDVSRSMDYGEQIIQRKGYAEAFRSSDVIEAMLSGGIGRIAVIYLEWAGENLQQVVVPWTLIDNAQRAHDFADALERHEPQRLSRTSISGAMLASEVLFGASAWTGIRRVVDISGDGPNNQGVMVEAARDRLVARGITINGLPLLVRPNSFGFGIEDLDAYYIDCVIGGTGAFSLPVHDWDEFPAAVRRKLVLEIAGNASEPRIVPAGLQLAQAGATAEGKTDCLIGEKLWDLRMRDMEFR